MLNPKVVLLSRSPNIKFGIYKEKDKSKIFIFGLVTNRNDSAFNCPTISYIYRYITTFHPKKIFSSFLQLPITFYNVNKPKPYVGKTAISFSLVVHLIGFEMKTSKIENHSKNIKIEVYQNFELYIKILSHYNIGKERNEDLEGILEEYGLRDNGWKQIVASWKIKIFNDPYLGLTMIPLLEKYNEYFSST